MTRARGFAIALTSAALLGCSPAFAADLEQQTKEVQLLIRKWQLADGAARSEIEQKLAALLEQRMPEIRRWLEKNPAIVLRVALPSQLTNSLPDSLKPRLEREVHLQAMVDQSMEDSSHGTFKLRDHLGRRLTLYCIGHPPAVVKGSTLSVSGYQWEDLLVADCSQGGVKPLNESGQSARALAIAFAKPKQGDVVRQTVEVAIELPKDSSVSGISLYKDGTLLGRRDLPPYQWRWNTLNEADGPHALTLRANDPDLNVGNASVTVTVDNTPPRISLVTPTEAQNVSGTLLCEAKAADVLGIDTVKFLVDGAAIEALVQPPYATRWNTAAVANGPHAVEAVAIDRAGNQARSAAVSVRVLNGNAAPVMTPIGPKTIPEGVTLDFSIDAYDVDNRGSPLTYKASNLPPWARFDAAGHRFSGTPDFSVASSRKPKVEYPGVLFEVCDPQPSCAREAITITVKNVNRAPVMHPIASQEVNEGQPLSIAPLITEPDGDAVECAVVSLPKWLHLDPKTCAVSGIPPMNTANENIPKRVYRDIRLSACDPEQACAEESFSLTVHDVERRAHLNPIGDKTVDEGRSLKFSVSASDPDRDPVALSAAGLPLGAVFKDNGDGRGDFSWTPLENQAGAYTVTLDASDRRQTDSETITITVKDTSLSISGIVQNSVGEPLADLTIEAANPNTFTRSVQTDAQGFYIIKDLTPGGYRVRPVFHSGLNLPGNEGYDFEPIYRQIKIINSDQNLVNFTAVPKQ